MIVVYKQSTSIISHHVIWPARPSRKTAFISNVTKWMGETSAVTHLPSPSWLNKSIGVWQRRRCGQAVKEIAYLNRPKVVLANNLHDNAPPRLPTTMHFAQTTQSLRCMPEIRQLYSLNNKNRPLSFHTIRIDEEISLGGTSSPI